MRRPADEDGGQNQSGESRGATGRLLPPRRQEQPPRGAADLPLHGHCQLGEVGVSALYRRRAGLWLVRLDVSGLCHGGVAVNVALLLLLLWIVERRQRVWAAAVDR